MEVVMQKSFHYSFLKLWICQETAEDSHWDFHASVLDFLNYSLISERKMPVFHITGYWCHLSLHYQWSSFLKAPSRITPRAGSMVCVPSLTWEPWCPVTLPFSMSTTPHRWVGAFRWGNVSRLTRFFYIHQCLLLSYPKTLFLLCQVLGKSCKPIPGKSDNIALN